MCCLFYFHLVYSLLEKTHSPRYTMANTQSVIDVSSSSDAPPGTQQSQPPPSQDVPPTSESYSLPELVRSMPPSQEQIDTFAKIVIAALAIDMHLCPLEVSRRYSAQDTSRLWVPTVEHPDPPWIMHNDYQIKNLIHQTGASYSACKNTYDLCGQNFMLTLSYMSMFQDFFTRLGETFGIFVLEKEYYISSLKADQIVQYHSDLIKAPPTCLCTQPPT